MLLISHHRIPLDNKKPNILTFFPSDAAMPKRHLLYATVGNQEALEGKGNYFSLPLCKPPALKWVSLDLFRHFSWHKSKEKKRGREVRKRGG